MSLIRCFECKKKISNIVDACPHCGYPMSKDYIKELNEIEEQIKEQQETIKKQQESIKVQVKTQVEQLGKDNKELKNKRALKRKLKKRLRKQNQKRKEINLFKYLFYISILIVIVLLFFVCNKIKELDTVNKKLETVNKELETVNKELDIAKQMSSAEFCKQCKDDNENIVCSIYEFTVSSENSIE